MAIISLIFLFSHKLDWPSIFQTSLWCILRVTGYFKITIKIPELPVTVKIRESLLMYLESYWLLYSNREHALRVPGNFTVTVKIHCVILPVSVFCTEWMTKVYPWFWVDPAGTDRGKHQWSWRAPHLKESVQYLLWPPSKSKPCGYFSLHLKNRFIIPDHTGPDHVVGAVHEYYYIALPHNVLELMGQLAHIAGVGQGCTLRHARGM